MFASARPAPLAALLALALAGCQTAQSTASRIPGANLVGIAPPAPRGPAFADIPYADWSDYEPPYRFYPGDEIEVTVPSAPELSKTVIVQPDGRISVPLVGPVMAADRTTEELQAILARGYATQLLRPDVFVTAKAAPLKVFVGGEVGQPGIYDLAGDADALRAVIQAGDFRPTADRSEVIVIRRGPGGRAMMRRVDLLRGLRDPRADLVPLRRFDIVYVPRSGVANAGLFVQQYFRDLSPITFGFNYAIGDNVVQ